jgi:activator of HSP90 ATPase
LNFLAANARISRKKVMELERAAGAQMKTEMDTTGEKKNSGIQFAEEGLMMSLNLKEQLQVMTELNQSIDEKMKCLEELRMQSLALNSRMTMLEEKTIPEITSTVSKFGGEILQSMVNDLQTSTHNMISCSEAELRNEMSVAFDECLAKTSKSGGEIVQSISALIGNTVIDIHGTIDDLHHKNAKIEGKIFSLEETMEVELAKLKEVSLSKIERLEMLHTVGGDLQSVQANAIQHIREELHERLLPCREWVDERLHFFLDLREEEAKKKGRRR